MNKKHLIATILSLILVAFILPATTLAAPANDNFDNATVISALPFSDSVSNTDATTEPDEPLWWCAYMTRTVWNSFTPVTNAVVRADMAAGSSFWDTNLNVYQAVAPGFGGLSFLGCASYYGNSVTFSVQAGATYYIQAGDSGYYGGGNLVVNLQEIPPPPNDDFANATVIPALPFSDTVDTTAATTEPGEPMPSCAYTTEGKSVWYAFTPSESGSVSASYNASFSPVVAAYTGDSLTNLKEVGCRAWGGWLTFHVDAGTTYYFQARGVYNEGGWLQFNLQVTPPPVANFNFYPYDPTVFDTIQFNDYSYDPVGVGIQSQAWDFGDGSIATGCCPTHRYAADGDYTVQLTVTTYDGRTALASQIVKVRTHDVAITRFSAPQAASSGQTRQISVGINSKRNPEYVQVQLFKSRLQGFEQFGSLTQSVPVRPPNRTTDFNFSYTFTRDDASIGKVTFKAVATITSARDALPADNETIASPTKVSQ